MRERIAEELELLRQFYPRVEHQQLNGEDWFLIPDFSFPEGWQVGGVDVGTGPVTFKIGASYPTAEPYGFAGPSGLMFRGTAPGNPGAAISPPFPGQWQHFSWAPDGWTPSSNAREGANLLAWVRSFKARLAEGA
jgi:hypothetical protein